ncbi:hypothetical protein N0K21_11110 [Yersinia aleksiciae]|uniref:hypothetical protein n=1 Tax=Yersinia aleksiciae TaxID=263819 RepID=UPI002E13F348|nr:hypothetical protein N0K21_11110 [Yersinia aleksiciae]
MNPIHFISKNITQQLMDEGYSLPVAQGANEAVDLYRRASQPTTRSRGIYDDCLKAALNYAKMSGEKAKPIKTAKKKKA